MAGEKTEAPTPRRRQEARKKGQVAKSMEVSTALVLLGSFWVLKSMGGYSGATYMALMKRSLSSLGTVELTPNTVYDGGIALSVAMLQMLAPLVAATLVIGVVANLGQVGLLFSLEALKPDPKRINPISGAKRFFSLRGVVDLLKSLVKIFIVGIVVYGSLKDNFAVLLAAPRVSVGSTVGAILKIAMDAGIRVGVVMLVIAAADYLYQRYEFEKSLKMSKQEIQEEMKRYENPQLKARIRSRQRQLAMNRMMAAVPKADVVITNPTHFAVALQYDRAKMHAPQVVAKGQQLVAQRIKEKAKENNVPLVENKPLARSLFKSVEIGQEIPGDLYAAVAEVLAFVYRLKQTVHAW